MIFTGFGAPDMEEPILTNTPRAGESEAQSSARLRRVPRTLGEVATENAKEILKNTPFAQSTPQQLQHDPVNHPSHYRSHPSGVECIQITEHMNFCLGNAVKYIWRASQKGDIITDLKKARWYLNREIERLEKI